MNRRSFFQFFGLLPFVAVPKTAEARPSEPERHKPCEVLYTRGVRRIEGAVNDDADYKKLADGRYVFYCRIRKHDYIERDYYDGSKFRHDVYRVVTEIPANTPVTIPWGSR